MAGFRELLAQAKREIREIEPADAEARLAETGAEARRSSTSGSWTSTSRA